MHPSGVQGGASVVDAALLVERHDNILVDQCGITLGHCRVR